MPDIQGEGEAILQGIWEQDSVINTDRLLKSTTHHFKFTCDSFYVNLQTRSKVNYYEDSCYNNGIWKEYAKGTYAMRNDTLFLTGTFTKANYKQKVSGCYRIGRYLTNFKVVSKDKDTLKLEGLTDQTALKLILKQKIKCVPKEL